MAQVRDAQAVPSSVSTGAPVTKKMEGGGTASLSSHHKELHLRCFPPEVRGAAPALFPEESWVTPENTFAMRLTPAGGSAAPALPCVGFVAARACTEE